MQPNYDDILATHNHRQPQQNIHQNHCMHHQQFMENDEGCSSLYNISNSLHNLNHHITQKQQQLPPFLQNHSIPITHQLFQAQLPFQPQQHGGDASHSQLLPPRHHRPSHPQNSPAEFRLGLEQNNHNCAPNVPLVLHPQEDSATIKEPFWKHLSTSYCEDEVREVVEEGKSKKLLENKNGSFDGELEAMYGLAKVAEANQTCSGSALTGEHSPKNTKISMRVSALQGQNAGVVGAADAEIGVDHGSENSIGEEASLRKRQKRVRKRIMREDLSSMAEFFENLVKQVMDHQEMLHRKFLEVIDKMDNERVRREKEWRKQEAAKYNREAMSRAHEQALASSREAKIVSCIEKITGQSMDLPKRKAPFLAQRIISQAPIKELTLTSTKIRWPKGEVVGLIQARNSIERKFQEPGLKWPLWEEVSGLMSSMGYQRSAKRCKEKWENINKYFKKAKGSSKKRSQQSKTCSYFNQLDHIYSTELNSSMAPLIGGETGGVDSGEMHQGRSELLEAFGAWKDIDTSENQSSKKVKNDEIGASRLDFDAINDDNVVQDCEE